MQQQHAEIETKIRQFLVEDMVKEEARVAAVTDELDLDSLDQTELRVFLEEEFSVSMAGEEDIEPFTTIKAIIDFVVLKAPVTT